MKLSRRSVFTAFAALSVTSLITACETITDGNTTTHSLDVGKVKRYAQAGLNAANTVVSILALNPSFLVFVAPIKVVSESLSKNLDVFSSVVGDKIEISYDDTNFKTLVNTLMDDLDRVLTLIGTSVVSILKDSLGLDSTLINRITVARDALATLVSVFKIMVGGFISTASGNEPTMTEAQALVALNVK